MARHRTPAESLDAAGDLVRRAERILILCHRAPDADTVGSALGLRAALHRAGKRAWVLAPDPVPGNLSFMPGFDTVGTAPDAPDLIVTVDASGPYRLGPLATWLDRGIDVVVVDHHASNPGFGTVDVIDAESAATAQVVRELIKASGLMLDQDVALCLYAGLFRDTDGFRRQTTARTLRLAAELAEAGADPTLVAHHIDGTSSLRQLHLEAHAVATMNSDMGGRLLWNEIGHGDAAGASEQEVEAGVERMARAADAHVVVLLHEVAPGEVETHIRSREPVDASAIATRLGGGGHLRRAGARVVATSLSDARASVLAAVRAELARHDDIGEA